MPISDFLIIRILNGIRKETDYDEDDIDMMRFSLQAILWEIEKLLYMFVLFLVIGFHWEFMAAMLAIITIRPNAGGFHSSSVWGCFAWSLLGMVLAIFVLPLIPLSNVVVLLVAVFSITMTYIATPVRSKQRQRIVDPSNDGKLKVAATVITVIWFAVLFLNQAHFLAPAVLWIIFLQNLQLIIEYLKQRHEKKVAG